MSSLHASSILLTLTHSWTNSSPWDIRKLTADEVGDRLALFALGSLVAMANLGPLIQVPGDVPHLGHSVQTYEPAFTIVWTCIVGTHLAVFVATVLSGRRAEQETPGQELQNMMRRAAEDESRAQLVGGDTGRAEGGGSIRRGQREPSEERSIEEQPTSGAQGFDHV